MKKSVLFPVLGLGVAMTLTACNSTNSGEVVLPKSAAAQTTTQTTTQAAPVVNNQPVAAASINNHAVANQISTIASLDNARDGNMVRLQGKVVRALRDERYELADATGSVVVEIDHELWQGRAITPNDTITVVGEVDVEYRPTKQITVDVEFIEF